MNTADRWTRIKQIFQAASERTGAERDAFLAAACVDDPALRQEIDELLQSDERADMFLELPAPEGLLAELSADPVGQVIGAYQVVREIGRGGMGSVYLAVRADDEYHKQVAIKVIKRGMDSREIIERFRRERQTLAGLVHPNIAPLLDGGTTADGLPYFVMDYVEGQPLDEYCDARRLSTEARLELFRHVCAGVQYAHQNLVVHRDLKPDNILVTPEGVPKLVDFGIAKMLSAEDESQTLTSLQGQRRPMTLAYASPEQVSGGTITTATDVYSLGVLLYELLTGHQPYRLRTRDHEEVARAIREQEPEKPSVAVTRVEPALKGTGPGAGTQEGVTDRRGASPDKLRRRLAGDIDTIVLKSLRKEPLRRYGSVAEFSEDVRRYLAGLPVIARKDTWGYRSGKFVTRHKTGVAAAVLVLLTLLGGLAAVAWQAQVARLEARKAERINNFLQSLLRSANPVLAGQERTVRQLLDEASQRVEGELAAEPDVRGAVQRSIADAYVTLGRYQEAEGLLKASLDTDTRLVGADHERVYQSLARLGFVSYHRGDFKTAETQLRQALDGLRRTLGADHETVADALNWLGLALNEQGKTAEAESYWKQALELRRRVDESGGLNLAAILGNLAVSRYNQGDLDQAEPLYQESIAVQRSIPGPPRAEFATAVQNLGVVYRMKKRYPEAEAAFRETIELRLKLLGKDHPYVAIARAHLAEVLTRTGDTAAAESEALAALDIQRRTLPEGHVDLARSLVVLGFAKTRAGRAVEGEPYLRQALAIRTKVLPKGNWLISTIGSTLGECLTAQGRYEEAEAELQRARSVLEAALGKTHPVTIENQERLAALGAQRTQANPK